MTYEVPERIRWTLELLDLRPQDRILEIGCGTGAAAALVCRQLAGGHLTAIDCSAVAVLRSIQRNAAALNAGTVDFQLADLAEFDAGGSVFDKVFAVNVNVFWARSPLRELDRLRGLMHPESQLLLVYDLPSQDRNGRIAQQIAGTLRERGFGADVLAGAEPSLWAVAARRR